MSFPQTRHTLIQRLASGGSEEDWQHFLNDYWGPICRFSLRWGAENLDDAEDVASQTFEVLWRNKLLVRWASHRSAKLRTLLCSVVRKVLANRHRARATRDAVIRDMAARADEMSQVSDEQINAFYVAWVEDVLQQAVESLATEYYRKNQGDYVRTLYGRLCEGLTIAEVAEALETKPSSVDYYFRHARQRLSEELEERVRSHVRRYCLPEEADQETAAQWRQLGHYLEEHGGLDEAVRRAYGLLDPVQSKTRRESGLAKAATRLTSIMRPSS